MFPSYKPFDVANSWLSLSKGYTQMNMAAAEVIFRRLMRMSQGQMSPSEAVGMVLEKSSAFAAATEKATVAAVRGDSPLKVAKAAIEPLRKKTRSNVKALRR